tara:strand:+ start:1947 stop:2495 length:549 start_codon:yes stop_codon:yes gene_type:complete
MAFIVEDGTGKSNANSYLTTADADSYIEDYTRNNSTWSGSSTAQKQGYIKEATQSLDLIWGGRFVGVKLDVNQALSFPRFGGYDREGYQLATDVVPKLIKSATAELAFKHALIGGADETTGDSSKMIPDIEDGGMISEESVSVGSIKSSTKYEGGKRETKWYRKVELILRSLLVPRGSINRA